MSGQFLCKLHQLYSSNDSCFLLQDEELVSEDEASYQDSSSESDDEADEGNDEGNEGGSPEARANAMAEARLMLKDQRSKKRRRDYLEDEVQHFPPSPPFSTHPIAYLCLPVAVP